MRLSRRRNHGSFAPLRLRPRLDNDILPSCRRLRRSDPPAPPQHYDEEPPGEKRNHDLNQDLKKKLHGFELTTGVAHQTCPRTLIWGTSGTTTCTGAPTVNELGENSGTERTDGTAELTAVSFRGGSNPDTFELACKIHLFLLFLPGAGGTVLRVRQRARRPAVERRRSLILNNSQRTETTMRAGRPPASLGHNNNDATGWPRPCPHIASSRPACPAPPGRLPCRL
jgi:hypothetical protein